MAILRNFLNFIYAMNLPFRRDKIESNKTLQLPIENKSIGTMYDETQFERKDMRLVLSADDVYYVIDGKLHSPLSPDDIKVFKNFLKLNIKKPVKEITVEETEELDDLLE